jgi:catechol 2,3-dioxygenase-like lactoylglutathione lyase family enzyme
MGTVLRVTEATFSVDFVEIHHLAVVVEDLERGMIRYSNTLGLSWAEPWIGKIPILVETRRQEPVVSLTLSLEGPPHMELIQSTSQMPWQSGAGLHHFGVWADDFENAVRTMTGDGFAVEAMSPAADFAYLRSPDAARIELVNGRTRPDFDRWLSGGRL